MAKHLQRELEHLKEEIISLGSTVETNLENAVKALSEMNNDLAEEVILKDRVIDRKEIEVEEECLKILALYQPVAIDLRFIVAVLKINNDLERIGDLAANIAKRTLFINENSPMDYNAKFNFNDISDKVLRMLEKSLDALLNLDPVAAKEICAYDDEIDDLIRNMHQFIKDEMQKFPEKIDILLKYLHVFRYLERIGDLATNIAEDTIYMVDGDIVRHGGLNY